MSNDFISAAFRAVKSLISALSDRVDIHDTRLDTDETNIAGKVDKVTNYGLFGFTGPATDPDYQGEVYDIEQNEGGSTDGIMIYGAGTVDELLRTKVGTADIDVNPIEDSGDPVSSGGVYAALAGKQDTLTFDDSPTENSSKPVKSGGVYDALAGKADANDAALTGTPTAPTAASGTNTTQIATTAFVMDAFRANDAMIFKGTLGTGGTVTALPDTHYQGWTYKVITAGTYAGQTCEVGDMVICVADGTSASNSDWVVVQTNIDGAVTGPASSTGDHIATFSGTSGKLIKDSGYTIAKSVPANAVFTDTTYESKTAASGGTDVSLVTTGEKHTWNGKVDNVSGAGVVEITEITDLFNGDRYSIDQKAADGSSAESVTVYPVSVINTKMSNKSDRPSIYTSSTAAPQQDLGVTMDTCTLYTSDLTSLTFVFAEWDDSKIVSDEIIFSSGSTATVIDYDSQFASGVIIWDGDGCTTENGISRFTPEASKKYYVVITRAWSESSPARYVYFGHVEEIPDVTGNVLPRVLNTVTGAPPITLTDCDGTDSLVGLEIYGDCSQSVTPTVSDPISVLTVGDYDSQTGKYIIPVVVSVGGDTVGTFNISLDEPLRGIGTNRDYIDFKNGKIVRKIGKYTHSASTTIQSNAQISGTNYTRFGFTPSSAMVSAASGKGVGYCTVLKQLTGGWSSPVSEGLFFGSSNHTIYAVIDARNFDASKTTNQNVYDYLTDGGTNVCEYYYVLDTPTETAITGLPTIVTAVGDVEMDIDTTLAPPTVTAEYYYTGSENE